MNMRRLAAAGVVAGALAACDGGDVTHFRVAKAPPPPSAPSTAPAAMTGNVPPPARPSAGLRWTLPKGWKETQGGSMRLATFEVPVKGTVDASVVVLPGAAGGELANVNRWRGQIGLGPTDEAGLAAARKSVATKAGPLKVYDFSSGAGSSAKRVIAGLTEVSGNTWFVKLTGDADAVGAARADFMKLLGSLRVDESH